MNARNTVSYDAVHSVSCEIANLGDSIARACIDLLGQYSETEFIPLQAQLRLINSAARQLALMADHCTEYDICGSADEWLDLPDMQLQRLSEEAPLKEVKS